MTAKQDELKLKRTLSPLVDLSDSLARIRLKSANLQLRQAELNLKRERVQLIRGEKSQLSAMELSQRISRLTDQLRENRLRVGRLRSARDREIGTLLGADFTYLDIAKNMQEFSLYASYFGDQR
jgi:hypothetical protein